jgi:hypothetical protein
MLTDEEKTIAEKLIALHKKHGGNIGYDTRLEFLYNIKKTYVSSDSVVNKLIAIDLMKYTLSDRTGMTSLTKKGWDFTNFANHDKQLMSQAEIDHLTIEKLRIDLKAAKRNNKMYWVFAVLTMATALSSIIRTELNINSTKKTELRVNTIDSAVHGLGDKLEQVLYDTSIHVSTIKPLH